MRLQRDGRRQAVGHGHAVRPAGHLGATGARRPAGRGGLGAGGRGGGGRATAGGQCDRDDRDAGGDDNECDDPTQKADRLERGERILLRLGFDGRGGGCRRRDNGGRWRFGGRRRLLRCFGCSAWIAESATSQTIDSRLTTVILLPMMQIKIHSGTLQREAIRVLSGQIIKRPG